jgi:outer membrane protein OmpA-like peptidoglycan-associated protein
VYEALIKMGVDKKRLDYKGYGHDKPAYDVNSLWENAQNRRVDFTIVSM